MHHQTRLAQSQGEPSQRDLPQSPDKAPKGGSPPFECTTRQGWHNLKGSQVRGTSLRVQTRHPRADPLPLSAPPDKAGTISKGAKSEEPPSGSRQGTQGQIPSL